MKTETLYILAVASPWGNIDRSPLMTLEQVRGHADYAEMSGAEWTVYNAKTGAETKI